MMREVTMREGIDHADDEFLKIVASECAACKREYGCPLCWQCTLNPANYTKDYARAQLIRSAYTVSHNRVSKKRNTLSFIGWIFFATIIFWGIMIIYSAVYRREHIPRTKPTVKNTKAKSIQVVEKQVQETINYVHSNLLDYNTDGEINCQDYCLLFKDYYPTSQIVYNPFIGDTGHVFMRVWTNDGWLYIEPQRKKDWYARDAWYGDKYNSIKQYNKVIDRMELEVKRY